MKYEKDLIAKWGEKPEDFEHIRVLFSQIEPISNDNKGIISITMKNGMKFHGIHARQVFDRDPRTGQIRSELYIVTKNQESGTGTILLDLLDIDIIVNKTDPKIKEEFSNLFT
ncbi:hypothetical protein [Leptospira kirschneri]|uniref:hypothetical protein n=1 Tax=Leptospira kirschneri TaxID=29507 RepID=UPI000360854B|nr:hypothetical protein [Leptospira kirschneri]